MHLMRRVARMAMLSREPRVLQLVSLKDKGGEAGTDRGKQMSMGCASAGDAGHEGPTGVLRV